MQHPYSDQRCKILSKLPSQYSAVHNRNGIKSSSHKTIIHAFVNSHIVVVTHECCHDPSLPV